MSENVYRIVDDENNDWDETYDMLRGPDGFECLLTEPEDRSWHRDGRIVVQRLNEQRAEIERLRAEREQLQHLRDAAVAWVRAIKAGWVSPDSQTWKEAWDRWNLENEAVCKVFAEAEKLLTGDAGEGYENGQ